MSFFDFFAGDQNTTAPANDAQAVTLFVGGGERVIVPFQQANGKTVSQLFREFAAQLGADAARVSRYLFSGNPVDGNTIVQPGSTYQGAANLDEKG